MGFQALKGMAVTSVVAAVLAAAPAWARNDTVPGSRYISGRGAALGDAFLPLSDDGAALFYNPAGLAKVRTTMIEPLNFQLQLNTGYFSMFDRNFYKLTTLKGYGPTLTGQPGSAAAFQGALFPNIAFRGFGFGILYQNSVWAQGSEDGATIRYRTKSEFTPTIGGGVRLASGVVRIGYSLQFINKSEGDVTTSSTADPIGYNEGLNTGSGLSHNAGIAVTLPVAYLPSINFVARNIFGTRYSAYTIFPLGSNPTSVTPTDDPMTFDASFSISPKVGSGGYMNLVFQYRDITNQSNFSIIGRLCAGVEFSFRDLFFLRGGFGSGYPSAGIGLKRKTAEFSLTWFSEERGTEYLQERDTRFMLHYQIRAF